MPVTKITRQGVRMAPRQVPTDTTTTIMPMSVDRVGQEAPEGEGPTKVSSIGEAFEKFAPELNEKITAGEEGTEFTVQLEFKSLADFDPKKLRTRAPRKPGEAPGKNDLTDLDNRIIMLKQMRERFTSLSVRRAWENPGQRAEIIEAVHDFESQLRRIAGIPEEGK